MAERQPIKVITAKLGMSCQTLVKWLRATGRPTISDRWRDSRRSAKPVAHATKWTPERVQIEADCRAAGTSVRATAQMLKISRDTLIRYRMNQGVVGQSGMTPAQSIMLAKRAELARRHWPSGISMPEMLTIVNAVPGPPLALVGLRKMLTREGIRRDPGVRTAQKAMAKREAKAKEGNRIPSPYMGGFKLTRPEPAPPIRIDASIPVVLPAPGPDGLIAVRLPDLMAWCVQNDISGFSGAEVDRLNRFRAARGLAPVVVLG